MLDVGAGGASLGLLLKRLYDVQTVSTVFADWPYCEYITERGGLCMLLDAMIAFPFAKFSYDAVRTRGTFARRQLQPSRLMPKGAAIDCCAVLLC